MVINLLVVGSLNMDLVVEVNEMPKPGETILGKRYELCPGGKGANQAYAASKLGTRLVNNIGECFKSNTKMIGVLGKDEYGEMLLQNLKSVGVDTRGVKILDYTTSGLAIIPVDKNGENSIIVIPGANYELSVDYINQNIDLIDECDIIIAQLEIPLHVVEYLADITKRKDKIFVLDPAPAVKNLPEKVIKNVDIMKPNETELQILTGMTTDNEENIIKAARSLINRGVRTVIVTLGSKGAILVTKNDYKIFPARQVEVVDTTAAGDTFTAALSLKIAEGRPIEEAIQFANIASSIVVTRKGAQSSIPSYDEVIEIYNQYYKK